MVVEPDKFHYGDTVNFVPATSYLNFLITYNLVLLPGYLEPGMQQSIKKEDEKVKSLFEQYFPERKVIQINPLGLNYNGGRMYCWSRQVPEKEK